MFVHLSLSSIVLSDLIFWKNC